MPSVYFHLLVTYEFLRVVEGTEVGTWRIQRAYINTHTHTHTCTSTEQQPGESQNARRAGIHFDRETQLQRFVHTTGFLLISLQFIRAPSGHLSLVMLNWFNRYSQWALAFLFNGGKNSHPDIKLPVPGNFGRSQENRAKVAKVIQMCAHLYTWHCVCSVRSKSEPTFQH